MRDKTHNDFIEKWADFVRTHDREIWKREQNRFIDAQIMMARAFFARMCLNKEGREIIQRLKEEKLNRDGKI